MVFLLLLSKIRLVYFIVSDVYVGPSTHK